MKGNNSITNAVSEISMIIFFGVGRIVIHRLAKALFTVISYDGLSFLRSNKINKHGPILLPWGSALRLAEGMVGIDEHRIAAEQDLEVGEVPFPGHPCAAVGHKIPFYLVGALECGHHEIFCNDVPVPRGRYAGFFPDSQLFLVCPGIVAPGKTLLDP